MTAKFSIHPHEDAQADLKELLRTHYFDARRIIAAIEQCENDRDLFRTMLSDEPTEDEEGINFQRWQRLRRKGVEVWRFKVLDLERDGKRYRIFYTSTDSRTVWILAVQPRNLVDYDDPNHPLANRIERAVDSLRPTAERAKQVRGRRVPDYVLTVTRTK